MKYFLIILLFFFSCKEPKARTGTSKEEILDITDTIEKVCMDSHVFYVEKILFWKIKYRAVNDNGLPLKCEKIEGLNKK